jgi:DNA-binding NtrC family response regulator
MMELSVLLVDDEEAFVEAMARRLGKRGYRVATATSGPRALEVLDQGGATRTDVVILDVKMPGMDGLEALAAIKERHPLVEVIMLTGHATVESAIEGMKRGAFDYLMKPCEMETLTAKLAQAGQKKRDHEAKILEARATLIALRRGD